MELELNVLHLLVASLAGCLPLVLLVRPLYSLLIGFRFHHHEVIFEWKEPYWLWAKRVRWKRIIVYILLSVSVLMATWANISGSHVSYIALSISLTILFLGLSVDLMIPPTVKITEQGIVIRTTDTISLLLATPRRSDTYFISWKRVIGVRLQKSNLMLMYLAHPRSSFDLFSDPLRHSRRLTFPVPKRDREEVFNFAKAKTKLLRSKIRLRRPTPS